MTGVISEPLGTTETDVVAGSSSGVVAALDVQTGGLVWSYDAASSVDGGVTVEGGVVYVASVYGVLHALDAATGAVVFTYDTGLSLETARRSRTASCSW